MFRLFIEFQRRSEPRPFSVLADCTVENIFGMKPLMARRYRAFVACPDRFPDLGWEAEYNELSISNSKGIMLIIFGGLPGSGKTTIARALAQRLNAVHVRNRTSYTGFWNSRCPPGPQATS
jgi:hypothetical protein